MEHSGKGHLEDLVCYGLEWERSVWFGMAKIWLCVVWSGIVDHIVVWNGKDLFGLVWLSSGLWLCVVWFGIVDHLGHRKAPPPRHHLSSDLPEFGFDFFI